MSPAISVLETDGRVLVAACRQLCADAGAAKRRSQAIRADLVALMGQYKSPAPPAPVQGPTEAVRSADILSSAENLIDDHGRRAVHVAYRWAAERAQAADVAGEVFWSGVINAIRSIQARPTWRGRS